MRAGIGEGLWIKNEILEEKEEVHYVWGGLCDLEEVCFWLKSLLYLFILFHIRFSYFPLFLENSLLTYKYLALTQDQKCLPPHLNTIFFHHISLYFHTHRSYTQKKSRICWCTTRRAFECVSMEILKI